MATLGREEWACRMQRLQRRASLVAHIAGEGQGQDPTGSRNEPENHSDWLIKQAVAHDKGVPPPIGKMIPRPVAQSLKPPVMRA